MRSASLRPRSPLPHVSWYVTGWGKLGGSLTPRLEPSAWWLARQRAK